MPTFHARFARRFLVVACILLSPSCYKYERVGESDKADAITAAPGRGRPIVVIMQDGRREKLRSPALRNDTLFDLRLEGTRAFPLSAIAGVEIQKANHAGTAAVVLLGVTAVVLAAAAGMEEAAPQPSTQFSCPLVYSWDGHAWRLDSGTFGGAIAEALARTDVDNLEHVRQIDNVVKLRVSNELDETDYLDHIALAYVDHSADVSVVPASDGSLHTVTAPVAATHAVDGSARDITPIVARKDDVHWESRLDVRTVEQAGNLTETIELIFPRPAGARHAKLVVNGRNTPWAAYMLGALLDAHGSGIGKWYAQVNSNKAYATAVRADVAETGFLKVHVQSNGRWQKQGLVWEVGPEIAKTQVVQLDLEPSTSSELRIRLEAPPSFWMLDYVAVDYGNAAPVSVKEAGPATATFNGSSVLDILQHIDGNRQKILTGERIDVTFNLPPMSAGLTRTFLLRTNGWYHVNSDTTKAPDIAFLRSIAGNPVAMQRAALQRRNDMIRKTARR